MVLSISSLPLGLDAEYGSGCMERSEERRKPTFAKLLYVVPNECLFSALCLKGSGLSEYFEKGAPTR